MKYVQCMQPLMCANIIKEFSNLVAVYKLLLYGK